MSCSLRSLLVLLAVFVMTVNVQAAGKGRRPAAHKAGKKPPHVSRTKVTHHRRPAVHHRSTQHARRRTTPNARRPVQHRTTPNARRKVARTTHRYPTHRMQRRVVVRSNSVGPQARRRHHHRRYTYLYYPGRYAWRTSYYNRGYGVSRRRHSRGVRGIVEAVQGNGVNGTVVLKVRRPRHSRFHYTARRNAIGRGATSQHRFHLNQGTRYEVMTAPRRRGSIADLHKGEHVLILRHAKSANTAQKVEVFARRKR